jgi:AraC family transcriptional regulator of adaptative response / DNA-3-methyladenine glycosylase II
MLPAHPICEQARLSRDARFDGLFFIAVTSTGIYCRPVCPAPAPRPQNIRYFANAAAAEQEGFRPCLRCRPELAPGSDELRHGDNVVARALNLIDAGELETQTLEQLAQRLAVSDRQLRRLFVEKLGAAPMSVHTTRRLLFAKQLLSESALPITQIALASGFRSVRRFNAAFQEAYRLAPRDLRKRPPAASGDALVLRLGYRPPFDFGGMLGFLRDRALPGLEVVGEASYSRVFGTAEAPGWLRVTAWGSGEPALRLEVHGAAPNALLPLVTKVRRMFDLDADPASIHAHLSQDARLRELLARFPGLRLPGAWDGFELAVRAVLGQQVSVAAARTLAKRLLARHGTPLLQPIDLRVPAGSSDANAKTLRVPAARSDANAEGPRVTASRSDANAEGLHVLFPSPATVAQADLDGLGITGARVATIRGIAQALEDGRIDFRRERTLDEFVARWTALPGIGAWTAHYIAMRTLSHPDAFPADDLILRRAVQPGVALTAKALAARAESWRPWRAYSVLPLWFGSNDF